MKRVSWIATGLILAGLLVWQVVFLGNPPRTILFPPPPDPPIPAVLDELSSVDVTSVPLATVVAELAQRHGTTIQLDLPGLQRAGITGKEKVTCRLKKVSLRSVLRHVARCVAWDLRVVSWNGVITITTEDEQSLPSHRVERFHSLADLLASGNDADLLSILSLSIDGMPAVDVDRFEWTPGGILASLPVEQHALLAELLAKLAEIARQPDSLAPVRVGEVRTPAVAAIEAALARRIDVNFVGVPLSVVAADLEKQLGVPIILDRVALASAGRPDPRIFGAIADVPAEYALSCLFPPYGLEAVLRDETLLITTLGVADDDYRLQLYPVTDLMSWLEGDGGQLEAVIASIPYRPKLNHVQGNALVVTHTADGHRQIERFLTEVRQAVFGTPIPVATGPSTWLRQRVTAKHDQIRWEELLNEWTTPHGIRFRIDPSAYESALLDPPIAVDVVDEPLSAALDRLLSPLGLASFADGERVVIATSNSFDIGELRCIRPTAVFAGRPIEATAPDWAEVFNTLFPGDLLNIDTLGDAIVVRSRHGQEPVLAFFEVCRRFNEPGPHAIVTWAKTTGWSIRLYPVADLSDNAKLASLLSSVASSAISPRNEVPFVSLPGILVVNAEDSVHQEVERLLTALRAWNSRPAGVRVRGTVLDDERFAAMQRPTTLVPRDGPLSEIAASLAAQHQVPLDVPDYGERSGNRAWLLGAPFETAFARLVGQHGLNYAKQTGGQSDGSSGTFFTRLYDVADLRSAARRPGLDPSVLPAAARDAVRESFPALVPVGMWDVLSRLVSDDRQNHDAKLRGDVLVARGPLAFHRLVERLLAAERRGIAAPSPDDPWAALRQPVSFDGDGLTAGEAIERLARLVRVPLGYFPVEPPQRRDPFAAGSDAPRVTLHVRDLPFRDVVRRLFPPPFELDVIVEDEMLVLVTQASASVTWRPTHEVHDARRIVARHPALADAALTDLLGWTFMPGGWGRKRMKATNVAGWLVVHAWLEPTEVSDWLAWLEREAPRLVDLSTGRSDAARVPRPANQSEHTESTADPEFAGIIPPATGPERPHDVELLLRQAHGDAEPFERGYACWRLSHWSTPDAVTLRTVVGWLKSCDEPGDWERQLCHLITGWGLPAEAVPWVAERLNDEKFETRRTSYRRLHASSVATVQRLHQDR